MTFEILDTRKMGCGVSAGFFYLFGHWQHKAIIQIKSMYRKYFTTEFKSSFGVLYMFNAAVIFDIPFNKCRIIAYWQQSWQLTILLMLLHVPSNYHDCLLMTLSEMVFISKYDCWTHMLELLIINL